MDFHSYPVGRLPMALSSILILILGASFALYSTRADRPGAYVWFYWPNSGNYNFDIDIAITDAPPTGIFWAHQFHFQNGEGGYFGVQCTDEGHKVDFAIWGAIDGGQPFEEFGSGRNYLIRYDWKLCYRYRLRIWTAGLDSKGNTWWGAWIYEYETDMETYVGSLLVPSSWGWLTDLSVVWVEYFGYSSSNAPYTRAIFSNPYSRHAAANSAPKAAQVNYGSTSPNSNICYLGGTTFVMEAGGNVVRTTPDLTWLWRS